jgi:hypothetical protein
VETPENQSKPMQYIDFNRNGISQDNDFDHEHRPGESVSHLRQPTKLLSRFATKNGFFKE